MKLERFKEKDNKRIGIIVFTIVCIMLVSGVILYRTFAIFEVRTNQNVINGNVQSMGDLEFAFYKDNEIVKEVPKKDEGYSLDTSSSYCKDLLNDKQISNVNWDYDNWEVRVKNVSTTKTKCYLYFKKIYQEEELNGAIPDLGNGRLVPVQIKEEQPIGITIQNIGDGSYGGKVVKADITQEWYKYGDQRWANAVILKDGVSDDYAPGDEILESDIESYFVWIPRYRYQLFTENPDQYTIQDLGVQSDVSSLNNIGKTTPIQITFENKNTPLSTGSTINNWLTHPAFTSFNSNGFWVGKFETGTTLTNNYNVINSGAVQIKPNTYSWRSIDVSHAFYTSYEYLRELESHMMKNMEWGAVAYLTQSKYGRCPEKDGNITCEEVRFNNSFMFVTGYAANMDPTSGYTHFVTDTDRYDMADINQNGTKGYSYYDTQSKIASTTGNYSGIYDLAGGAWESVMGVMQASNIDSRPASGPSSASNSGFKGPYSNSDGENTEGLDWPSSKYYDLYDYGATNQGYQRGKLGDATKETGPFTTIQYRSSIYRIVSSWFHDHALFINLESPWIVRGGERVIGSDSGIFCFDYRVGNADNPYAFRIILSL